MLTCGGDLTAPIPPSSHHPSTFPSTCLAQLVTHKCLSFAWSFCCLHPLSTPCPHHRGKTLVASRVASFNGLLSSSSQADDRWELAICVTEVPRSQPRLTQLCPQRHWDPPWGTPGCPLAERLQAGASGQPVPPRCSRCSFSCKETTPPTPLAHAPCSPGARFLGSESCCPPHHRVRQIGACPMPVH